MSRDRDAGDLRWFFLVAESEMGMRSNFGSLVSRLSGLQPQASSELDDRKLIAARRARGIMAKLERLPRRSQEILRLAFNGAEALDVFALVAISPSAAKAHRASKTVRPFAEWLVRLRLNAEGQSPDPRRQKIWAELRRSAQLDLDRCLGEYASVKGEEAETWRSRPN